MPLKRTFRVATACLTGLALFIAAHGEWTHDVHRFLAWWVLLAVSYLAVLFAAGTFSRNVPNEGAQKSTSRDLIWALGLLLVVRVVLALGEPLLSDDIYRSVWEGRVQRASGNPFAWTDRPEAEKWLGLRDAEVYPRINHKDYAAIYPPAWQWAMRGVNALSDSVSAVKLFLVACEIVFWLGLARLLRARNLPPSRVLIAAASPLAIIEVAGSGHSEAMGMAALVWTMVFLDRKAHVRAAVALSMAVLSKLAPAILALSWVRKFRFRDYGVMLAVAAVLSAPYLETTAFWSLQKYGDLWRFNETLFALNAGLTGSHRGGVALSAVFLLGLAWLLLRRGHDVVRSGLVMTVALILLIPNVLPWYTLWLLVFLPAATPSPLSVMALVFTLTVPLSYLVYPGWLSGAPWYLSWSIRALEYGGPVFVGAVSARWLSHSGARTRFNE